MTPPKEYELPASMEEGETTLPDRMRQTATEPVASGWPDVVNRTRLLQLAEELESELGDGTTKSK
jgi:hypothetical protein